MRRPDDYERGIGEYEGWYEANPEEHDLMLTLARALPPHYGLRLGIGAGTARFGKPLDIQVGLDPSRSMRRETGGSGIVAVEGVGEKLPFAGESFDSVLMVNTFIWLDDRPSALEEIRRVSKPASALVVGFYDAASRLGKHRRDVYRDRLEAVGKTMSSADEVTAILLETTSPYPRPRPSSERPICFPAGRRGTAAAGSSLSRPWSEADPPLTRPLLTLQRLAVTIPALENCLLSAT